MSDFYHFVILLGAIANIFTAVIVIIVLVYLVRILQDVKKASGFAKESLSALTNFLVGLSSVASLREVLWRGLRSFFVHKEK